MKKLLAMLAVAAAVCLSADSLRAQDNGGGGGGRGGFRGFDPQQMMDNIKDRLGFTNDTDWSAVQPLVQKVMDARRDSMSGMFRGFRRRGGDNGGGGGNPNRPSNAEADALQQAVDSNAPAAQIKAALEKYRTAQKARQAKLEQAQEDLRKVLSQKQEAQAVLMGLLN